MSTTLTREQLEEKLAQAYQVIGALLEDRFETNEGQGLLDYFGRDQFDPGFLAVAGQGRRTLKVTNNLASTDHGSVLPGNSSALVVDESGSLSMLLADYPDDAEVPLMVQLLAAVAILSDDQEWVEETSSILRRNSV